MLKSFEKKYGLNIEQSFTSWVGSEISLIVTEPAGSSLENNVYACILANNADKAIAQLYRLGETIAAKSDGASRTEKYRDHFISSIPVAGIQMVHSDGGLDQSLIKQSKRPFSNPPQVFPGLMGFEIPSGVEKKYSVLEQIGHRCWPVSY